MELSADGPKTNLSCSGTPDLQQQLRQLLETAVTPSRAQHLAITFTFRSTVAFQLAITEAENEALEHAGNVDPSLGEGRTGSVAPAHANSALVSRDVSANDTIMNQPQDNPVLQRAVAKHLIAALGDIDGSNWVVRGVSRLNHGWTFTYICKDSRQEWKRQSSKRVYKTAMAEYSAKDGSDPVHLSRPAFDCRGAVTISFVKATRTIQVKYDHTALHKSVAQLIDLLAPPPPPPATVAKKPAPRSAQASEGRKKSKAKRKRDGVDGAEAPAPKRRRKTTGDAADGDTTRDDLAIEGAAAGEMPSGKPAKKRTYKKKAKSASGQEPAVSVKEAGPAPTEVSTAALYGVNAYGVLNLPRGEAERRRATAVALLEDKGIDPKTLSDDQFNIFANQSPDLQRESLAMLVKYGAERLRIVHPNKEGEQASASPLPGAAQSVVTTASSGQADDGAGGASTVSDSANARAQNGRDEAGATSNGAKSQPKTPKVRETRGACDNCKSRRAKCAKERPSCAECLEAGLQCYYAPAKSKKKSETDADDGEETPQLQQHAQESDGLGSASVYQVTTGPFALHTDQAPTDLPDDDDTRNGSQAATIHPLRPPDSSAVAGQYQSLAQPVLAHDPPAGLAYPSSQLEADTQYPLQYATQQSSQYPEPDPPVAPQTSPRRTSKQSKNSRRSLPAAPQPAVPNWNTATSSPLTNANGTTPTPSAARPDRGAVQHKHNSRTSTDNRSLGAQTVMDDNNRQNQGWSQITVQQPAQQSPHSQAAQSSQAMSQPSRTRSRQAQKGHSSTPAQEQTSTSYNQRQVQAAPPAVNQPSFSSSTAPRTDPSNLSGYDTYGNYSSGNADQSSARAAYDPFTDPAVSTTSYPAFDTFNSASGGTSSTTLPPATAAGMSASYPSALMATSPWTAPSQPRSSSPYSLHNSVDAQNRHVSGTQSPSQQGGKGRPPPPATSRNTSASTYANQSQQSRHLQQQQQHQQQHSSYSMYSSQPPAPSSSNNQQNWYGFTSANATSSAYGGGSSRATGGGPVGGDNSYVDIGGSSNSHNQPNRHLHPQPPGWV